MKFLEASGGHLDAANWEALSGDYSQLMGTAMFSRIWDMRRQNYHPEFQNYVDNLPKDEYINR